MRFDGARSLTAVREHVDVDGGADAPDAVASGVELHHQATDERPVPLQLSQEPKRLMPHAASEQIGRVERYHRDARAGSPRVLARAPCQQT
jgi:hypothetical protein